MREITWLKEDSNYLIMCFMGLETNNMIFNDDGTYNVYFNSRTIGKARTLKEAKQMILLAGGYLG